MFNRLGARVPLKMKEYFKDNPGALFVLGFQLLLVACAGLLIQGSLAVANEIATYAFFLLVVGVILQFVAHLRHRNDAEEKHDGE